jgi:hypothetical protein
MFETVKEMDEEGTATITTVRFVELVVQLTAAIPEIGEHVGLAAKDIPEGNVKNR